MNCVHPLPIDRRRGTMRLTGISACLLAIGLTAAHAQTVGPAGTAGSAADQSNTPAEKLDAVEVTAGKRKQNLKDVAGTVSVVRGSTLEANGAQDQEAILKLTPGVQVNKGDPNQSLPTIRGVGTVLGSGSLGLQQSTTGIYIEDVPFTDPTAFILTPDLAPFDLERVEVLRGPQGALFGSASLGGAIRYVVNKPNLTNMEFSILGTGALVSHGGLDASAYLMANLPLSTDVAAVRIVAFDRHDSGYIDNLGTGETEANALHQWGGRAIGTFVIAPRLKVTGMLMTQTTSIDGTFAVSPNRDQLQIRTPVSSTRDSRFSLGNLQVELGLGDYTLTSNTGIVDKRSVALGDVTRRAADIGPLLRLPLLPVVVGGSETNGHSQSQEFRLSSPNSGLLTYVAGLFYQHSAFDASIDWNAPGGAALWGAALPGDVFLRERDQTVTTETAVFADGELRVTDAFSAGAGGRFYRNKARYNADSRLLEPLLGKTIFAQYIDESGFTPKLDVKYRFGENTWYALASKGYRFGGVNPGTGTSYKSDSLWNYETGVRLSPAKALDLDLSVFYIDWKDAQVNSRSTTVPALNGIANVGKARVEGVEVAAKWRVLTTIEVGGSAAYTIAETVTPFLSNTRAIVPDGTRLPGTPRFQSNIGGTYRFQGPMDTSGRFDLMYSFTGRRTLSIDRGGDAPAYRQLDAHVSFISHHWILGAYMNNITDKRGVVGGAPVSTLGGSSYVDYYLTKPRTVGVSLRYDL